jgi:hypothetical protein
MNKDSVNQFIQFDPLSIEDPNRSGKNIIPADCK